MVWPFSKSKASLKRALLITSDDFGMTLGVNQGIERGLREGLVGATNLMAPCPAFDDAAARVKAHSLPAGIHLTLTSEWDRHRWGPLTDNPKLRAEDGGFYRTYAALPSEITPEEIRAEFDLQLATLRSNGIEPTHIDTHMISSESAGANELKVKAVVRHICSDEGLIYTYDTDERGELLHFDSETLGTPMTVKELKKTLSRLGEGVHHLVTHCAEPTDDLEAMCSPSDPARPWAVDFRTKDLELLTSEDFRAFVHAEGFEILGMREFLRRAPLASGRRS